MIEILRHDSRVYSIWVNGSENFYFKATPGEIGELIRLYSEARLRDHVVIIKKEKKEVRTFKRDKIDYNVNFHYLGGIALAMNRRSPEAETYEPTLTIYVDAGADQALSKQITIPDNVIVKSGLLTRIYGRILVRVRLRGCDIGRFQRLRRYGSRTIFWWSVLLCC